MSATRRPRTAIVGAGRLGRVLVELLPDRGYAIGVIVVRRSTRGSSRLAVDSGARVTRALGVAARACDLILLAVPDREIETVARRLAAIRGTSWSSKTVLHHAGALGLEPLDPLRRAGAETGLLHPLQSISGGQQAAELLSGSRARIEGTPRAAHIAERLARDLGLVPLRFPRPLDAEGRALYHAAAALVGNDAVALLDLAADLLVGCGVERSEAIAALAALGRGALSQVETRGIEGALTGPVVRGDGRVVAAHLRLLRQASPATAEIHRLLSRRLLRLAARLDEPLDPAGRRRVARALADES